MFEIFKIALFSLQNGLWLSLVERLVRDQEAVGSNPTSPIDPRVWKNGYVAGVAVLVSSTEIKYKGVWHKRLYTHEFF